MSKWQTTAVGRMHKSLNRYELDELGEFKNGVNFSKDDFSPGLPVINVKNLFDGRYASISKLDEIRYEAVSNLDGYRLRSKDILIARSSVKASGAGQVAMIKELPKQDTVFSGFIIRFRSKNNLVNALYLNYLLRSNIYRAYFPMIATGTTITNLSQQILGKVPVYLPPVPTQRRIVAILSSLDDKIENNRKTCEKLEEIASAMFKRWFVDFEFPDKDGKSYNSSGGRMVESELGLIPEGWECGKLKEIVDNIKINCKPKDIIGFPYLPIDFIPKKQMGISEFDSWENAKSSLIRFSDNDIILGAMRVYFHRVVLSPFEGVTRTTCIVMRPKNTFDRIFSLLQINQDILIDWASNNSKGSTMPYSFWKNGLETFKIVISPKEVRIKFEQLLHSTIELIKKNYNEQLCLQQTRDTLLPKLIRGLLVPEGLASELDVELAEVQR
jgi:type I restriction enzyme, S subunit